MNKVYTVILLTIAVLIASYLAVASTLWAVMWGLCELGVALPIAWSWGLSAVVWLVLFLLKT